MLKKKRGFTLVELLVVIAIIGILIGLLLPAVQAVRQAARRTQCTNNLKQWSLAALGYEGVFGALPGSRFSGPLDTPAYTQDTGWMVSLLPYVEEQNLYDQFELRTYTFAVTNAPVTDFRIKINTCPSAEEPSELFDISEFYGGPAVQGAIALTGDYAGNGGYLQPFTTPVVSSAKKQGAVPLYIRGITPPKTTLASIRDGQSNTFYMWDSAGAEWYWLQNRRVEIGSWDVWMANYTPDLLVDENSGLAYPSTPESKAYFCGWAGVNSFQARLWDDDGLVFGPGGTKVVNVTNSFRSPFSFHPDVVMAAYADGSVRTVQESIQARVFFEQCSRFGGESTSAQ